MILRYQLRLLVRNGRFLPAIALFVASFLVASIAGISRFKTEAHAAAEFDQLAREHITRNQEIARGIEQRISAGMEKETIPPPFGSRAPNYVYTWCHPAAVLPPGPLTWMTIGKSDLHPTIFSGPGMTPAEISSNPLMLWNGYFDLSFVIAQILPIVIILLTFDLAAGGPSSGVLALTLAQPISFRRFLLLSILPPAAVVLGAIVTLIAGAAALSGTSAASRVGLWLGSACLYATFWLALSLVVNAVTRSPQRTAVTLFGAWLTLNLLVPTASNIVANAIYPIPSRAEFATFERGLGEQTAKRDPKAAVEEYIAQHPNYGETTGLDPQGYRYVVSHAVGEFREGLIETEESRVQEQRRKQEKLASFLSIISPATQLMHFMIEISGASDSRREDFLRQKSKHLLQYSDYFRPRIYQLPNSIFRSADYDLIPKFRYIEEPVSDVWKRAAVPSGFLLLLAVLASGAAARVLAGGIQS